MSVTHRKRPKCSLSSSFNFGFEGKRGRVIGRLRSPPATSPRGEEGKGREGKLDYAFLPCFLPSLPRLSLLPILSICRAGRALGQGQANVFPCCEKEQFNSTQDEKRRGRASFVLLASPLETAQSPPCNEKLHRCLEEEGMK